MFAEAGGQVMQASLVWDGKPVLAHVSACLHTMPEIVFECHNELRFRFYRGFKGLQLLTAVEFS